MDNITHGLVGGWIMDAVLGKSYDNANASWRKRNKIMIVGGLIANIPDIDVFINRVIPWSKPIDEFMFHRSYTHTFLFALLASLLVGWLGAKYDKQERPTWRRMLASFLTICIGHLFVDYMTTYGIRFLLPFSSTTFSADNIFVIDLIYTIPLIILWLIYTFVKKARPRRIMKIISWVWLILYPLFTLFAKHIVTEKFTDSLDAKNISYSRVYTTPEPLQAFLWRGVVQGGVGYYEGYYSLFDKTGDINRRYIDNDVQLKTLLKDKPDVQKVENFAQGRTSYSSHSGVLLIDVIKMGGTLGRTRPATDDSSLFAFRVTNTGYVVGQQGRGKFLGDSFSDVWNKHWERVWGEK